MPSTATEGVDMENKEKVEQWLRERGISDGVIKLSNIHYDGRRDAIAIPIYDSEGTFLFNKYRRAPWRDMQIDGGPKYKYEAGSTAQLYNISKSQNQMVIICEGELDSLLLMSHGYFAVSSTGGSGTFLPEWKSFFDGRDVYICYDTDDAGVRGAFKVQALIPHAKIIWLPKGKDVTDFFLTDPFPVSGFANLFAGAKSYPQPQDIDWHTKKSTIKQAITANEQAADFILSSIDMARQEKKPYRHLEMLLEHYNIVNDAARKRYKFLSTKNIGSESKIADAKKVPITNFLEFPYTKTINCIWHQEDTPSMHYYEQQNIIKCFGCQRRCDVIDVVQQLYSVTLPEAIDIILKKH